MYYDLVKAIRKQCSDMDCGNCNTCVKLKAADAIEELSRKIESLESMREITPEAEYAIDKHADNIISHLDELIRGLKNKPRWIPVTERLPEQEKQVLVTGIEAIGNVQIYGVKQLDGDVWRPTSAPSCYWEHWMPLPEPPKEET